MRCGLQAGRREAAGDRGASGVQGRARVQIGSRARGGAHVEHVAHVRDAGRVEGQRLVERIRALPSQREGRRCGARCGSGGGRACKAVAARAARFSVGSRTGGCGGHGARAERTWNIPVMSLTLDVLKVSSLLNAHAPCRVEGKAYDAGRGSGREVGGSVRQRRRERGALASGLEREAVEATGHARSARRTSRSWR